MRLKLRRLRVRNFLSFGDEPVEMDFGDASVSFIVGPNNSGKSNLFRTLNFTGEAITRTPLASEVAKYLPSGSRDFEIRVGVKLSEAEHQALLDFMVLSTLLYNPGGSNADQQLMTSALKGVLPKQKGRLFGGIGREIEIVIRGTQRDASPITHFYKIEWEQEVFMVQPDNCFTKVEIPESAGFGSAELGSLLFERLKLKIPSAPQDKQQSLVDDQFEPPSPPKVIKERLATVSDPVRSMFTGVSVRSLNFQEFDQKIGMTPELRRFRGFLEDRGFSDNGITFVELLALIYTSSMVWIADLRGTPSEHVPIAWERPVERAALPIYGTTTWPKIRRVAVDNLAGWLFELSSAGRATDHMRYREIQHEFHTFTNLRFRIYLSEDEVVEEEPNLALVRIPPGQVGFGGADIPEFAALGIQVNKSRKMVKTAGIQITDGKSAWPVGFASAGTVEVLCLLTGIIGTKDGILLLDEPVQNMHPEFQYMFLRLLDRRLKADGNQALVITHSPFLLTRNNLENTWYVTKKNDATAVVSVMRKLAEIPRTSQGVVREFDRSDVRSILFGRGAVIVEGLSDKWVLEEIDRKAASAGRGPRLVENEWPIISLNTKNNTEVFFRLVEQLGLNHVFLLDRDAEPIVKRLLQTKGDESWGEEIMRENGFFLLKSDLDDLFGITEGNKQLKALQKAASMRLEEVPHEYMEFMAFLEKRISDGASSSSSGG
jgi:energy-coupling factor transporter ATP-binding protein EcfA2